MTELSPIGAADPGGARVTCGDGEIPQLVVGNAEITSVLDATGFHPAMSGSQQFPITHRRTAARIRMSGVSGAQRVQMIRFAIETLRETNGHHEFERLCLGLARRRIASNLIPATGPVGSGGDQGRDAESHWTNLPAGSDSLVSPDKVVLACTIRKSGVTAKIREDLASICGQGDAVHRVVYFTATGVPVGKRHELQAHARQALGVELEIWDAAAIAETLSDPDLFDLAAEFLHLPVQRQASLSWLMPTPDTRGAVARPELVEAIVDTVSSKATVVGIDGAGGFGKTTLATQVCRNAEVREQFSDRLLWLTLGQQVAGVAVATAISDLIEYLTGHRPAYSDPTLAGAHLAEVLGERKCLLVLDDVWHADQLAPFLFGAPNCTRLITTRIAAAIPAGAARVRVDPFTPEQAGAVLGRGMQLDRNALVELTDRAGRWPILCGLINANLRRRIARGETAQAAVQWVGATLDHGGPAALDPANSSARGKAIAATITASLTMLAEVAPHALERFQELGVFPTDTDIPLTTLTDYWCETGEVDRFEADRLCHLFADANLVETFRLDTAVIRLHDVVAEYLEHAIRRRAQELHAALLDGHRKALPDSPELPTAWWRLPGSDQYLWRHLAFHLGQAGRTDELASVLHDLRWPSVKIHRLGPDSVVADAALLPDDVQALALTRLLRSMGHRYRADDSMVTTIATFAAYATGDPVLGAAARTLIDRIDAPHLRPTALPLPDQPHPALSRVLSRDSDRVRALVMAPDGTWLASTAAGSPIRVWDTNGWAELCSIPDPGAVALVAGPDSKWLASGGIDGLVRVWSWPDGTLLRTLTGFTSVVDTLLVTPGARCLAAVDRYGDYKIWYLDEELGDQVASVDTEDEDHFAYGQLGRRVTEPISEEEYFVYITATSPDMSWMATVCRFDLWLWDPATERLLCILAQLDDSDDVSALAAAPDGSLLAAAMTDATVRLWKTPTGNELASFGGHSEGVSALAFGPDGSWLACGTGNKWDHHHGGEIRIWSIADRTLSNVLPGHSGAIQSLVPAPDGSWLASSSVDGTVRIWDLAGEHATTRRPGHATTVTALTMAPDGSWAASGDVDGSIRLWNTTDGSERAVIDGHDQSVVCFAVAPDGSWLASAAVDGSVRLWNTVDGARRAVLKRTGDRVRHLVATPDGARLAASTGSDRLWLWDVHRGKLVVWPHKVDFEMHELVVAPDGSWLAGFGSKRGYNERGKFIALWRPSDGVLMSMVPAHTDDIICTAASTPDSLQLVIAGEDTHLRFYKIADGTWESITVEDMGFVHTVVFAPGGAQLVTIDSDSFAQMWNFADRVVYPLPHMDEEVTGVAIAPDGSWMMTVGDLGCVRLFDPEAAVWASLRLDSRLEHCVINPARPQVVVAGSNHVYFLDVSAN